MVSVYVLDTLYEQTILIAAHYSSVTAKVKLERKKKGIGYLINDIMTSCALSALLPVLVCTAALLVCLRIAKRKIMMN
jgi:hypothetical protein